MGHGRTALTVFAVALAGCGERAADESDECSAMAHEVETLVCGDPELLALDRRMSATFGAALERLAMADEVRQAERYQAGWLGGRNDCWKSTDVRQCVIDSYERRIAGLEARYGLVEPRSEASFTCDDGIDILVVYHATEVPTVRLERGGTVEIGWRVRAASGSKYEAPFGIVFWARGDEAMVEWPQGTEFRCRVSE